MFQNTLTKITKSWIISNDPLLLTKLFYLVLLLWYRSMSNYYMFLMAVEVGLVYLIIYKPTVKHIKYAFIAFPVILAAQIITLSLRPLNTKTVNMHMICVIHTFICLLHTMNYYRKNFIPKYRKGIKFEIPADSQNIIKTNTEIRSDMAIEGHSCLTNYIVNN